MKKTFPYFEGPRLRGLFCCLLLTMSAWQVRAQFPFKAGEKINYELVYQWGLIWASAGTATFSVEDTLIDGVQHYRFQGSGKSYDHWNWFYEVNSTYTSVATRDFRPLTFVRKGVEGSAEYDRKYTFGNDSIRYRLEPKKRSNDIRKGALAIRDGAMDVVTAVFYCRSLDFTHVAADETVPLLFVLDGEYYESYVRYLGQEQWEDPRTEKIYNCDVFTAYLIRGTIFREGERIRVYVSGDDRKAVYIETDLRIGKAKIYLND